MGNVKLIDVYSRNEWVEFQELVDDGYTGVIFKAGQGGWADVPRYKRNWFEDAGKVGLLRGWYWLVDSRYALQNHKNEFRNWFTDYASLNEELGFWVDVEKPQINMNDPAYRKTPYAGYKHVESFCGFLEGLGINPGIYTSPGAFNLILGGAPAAVLKWFGEMPLWTAQYYYNYQPGISKPKLYGEWKEWTFWQWRERPDVNIYSGSDDEFYERYGIGPVPSPEPEPNEMPNEEEFMYEYESNYSMSLRASNEDEHIKGTKVETLPAGTPAIGDKIYTYMEAKEFAYSGDMWMHVTGVNGVPKDLWVAIIHRGRTYGQITTTEPMPEPNPEPSGNYKTPVGGLTVIAPDGRTLTNTNEVLYE